MTTPVTSTGPGTSPIGCRARRYLVTYKDHPCPAAAAGTKVNSCTGRWPEQRGAASDLTLRVPVHGRPVIHDRTPLILPPDRVGVWRDPHPTDPGEVAALTTGIGLEALLVRAVNQVATTDRN